MQRLSIRYVLGIVLSLGAAAAFGARRPATDASSVRVIVDGVSYQCTARGSGTGSDFLVSGSYKNLAGNDLCPQAVRANVENGVMTSLTVTVASCP